MLTILRRCLFVAVLLFWQGGFTFYASVVVPIGSDVLGSHAEQARITRRVVVCLNIAGAVALPLLAWDFASANDDARWRRRSRWGLWAILLLTLLALYWLHAYMDGMMSAGESRERFYPLHQWYLLISSVQWAACVLAIVLTLLAWRREDQAV